MGQPNHKKTLYEANNLLQLAMVLASDVMRECSDVRQYRELVAEASSFLRAADRYNCDVEIRKRLTWS